MLHPTSCNMIHANVTTNIVDQLYAMTFLDICRQAKLEPSDSGVPGRPLYLLIRPPATTEPSWADGPAISSSICVCCTSGSANQPHRSGKRCEYGELEAEMAMRDPKGDFFQMAGELEIDEAKDDHGHSLLAARPPNSPPIAAPLVFDRGQWIWNASATLNYPPADSHTIALLRGRLHAALVTRSEPTELIRASARGRSASGAQMPATFASTSKAWTRPATPRASR